MTQEQTVARGGRGTIIGKYLSTGNQTVGTGFVQRLKVDSQKGGGGGETFYDASLFTRNASYKEKVERRGRHK